MQIKGTVNSFILLVKHENWKLSLQLKYQSFIERYMWILLVTESCIDREVAR